MKLTERKLSSEIKYQGRIITAYSDKVQLPDGNVAGRDVVRHPGAVVIVPVLENGNIVVVEQYRYPLAAVLMELPAGKLDAEESFERCAKRELLEETGYNAKKMEYLGKMATTPGFCDEIIHVFKATQLVKQEACPDEDEFLNVREITLQELRELIKNGGFYDAKSITALFYAGYCL